MSILYCIGGGDRQHMPVLEAAQKLGLGLVVTDVDENSPGMKIADRAKVCHNADIQAHLKLAELVRDEEIAGVITFGSYKTTEVRTLIQQRLEVESPPMSAIKNTLSQFAMREMLGASGISVPRTVEFASGCALIDAETDAFLGESPDRAYVQEVIPGDFMAVEGCFIADNFYGCGIMRIEATCGVAPHGLGPEKEKTAYDLLEKCARMLGISSGPVTASITDGPKGFVLQGLVANFSASISSVWALPHGPKISPWTVYLHYLAKDEIEVEHIQPVGTEAAIWRTSKSFEHDIPHGTRIYADDRKDCWVVPGTAMPSVWSN
jgi:hypothetical protein